MTNLFRNMPPYQSPTSPPDSTDALDLIRAARSSAGAYSTPYGNSTLASGNDADLPDDVQPASGAAKAAVQTQPRLDDPAPGSAGDSAVKVTLQPLDANDPQPQRRLADADPAALTNVGPGGGQQFPITNAVLKTADAPVVDQQFPITTDQALTMTERLKRVSQDKHDEAADDVVGDFAQEATAPGSSVVLPADASQIKKPDDPNGSVVLPTDNAESGKRLGSTNAGVAVVLPDGSYIPDEYSPTKYVMSPVNDLAPVAEAGRRAGATFRSLLSRNSTALAALPYLMERLGANVGTGGAFDYQRNGNVFSGFIQSPQFRNVANINVGLFCQQAGISLDDTLFIAGQFAKLFSKNYSPNEQHGLDPRTLQFIVRGYNIGKSGVLKSLAVR